MASKAPPPAEAANTNDALARELLEAVDDAEQTLAQIELELRDLSKRRGYAEGVVGNVRKHPAWNVINLMFGGPEAWRARATAKDIAARQLELRAEHTKVRAILAKRRTKVAIHLTHAGLDTGD